MIVLSIDFAVAGVSKLKIKKVFIADSLVIDTLSIVPGELKIFNGSSGVDETEYFDILFAEAKIKRKRNNFIYDSLTIKYRTFDVLYSKKIFKKDIAKIEYEAFNYKNPYTISLETEKQDYFKTEGLNKTGSLSRGISFGNNQDVVVNSGLNLQLNGKLSDKINITAAISDNNIPIQPDGNTQQLQEFDRVYIQLYDEKNKLIVGDFQMQKPNSYFMSYNKRAQGGTFSSISNIGEKKKVAENSIQVSAAVSRGKFSRNIILGIERNQGPYRLKGAENESFIVVLANTERIYIDGELLKRGQENDYVINYNSAEVTFTAKRIITKDKRIVAEFQYSDRNYARSLLQFSDEIKAKNSALRINIFSEQDNKNKPLLQDLTDVQKEVLGSVGDNTLQAITPSIDTVEFNSSDILYLVKDSIIDGIKFPNIYEFSVNPQKAFYKLSFSQVTRGNYVQISSVANGKVYQWIKPINGIPQGNYEPVVLLIAPKQKQMFSIGGEQSVSQTTKLNLEAVVTNNNINTFSSLDKSNDVGLGLKLGINNSQKLFTKDSTSWILNSTLDYEQISRNFIYIERYRAIEFERDWNRNLSTDKINSNQRLGNAMFNLSKGSKHLSYGISFFNEQTKYNGLKHSLAFNYHFKQFSSAFKASILNAKDSLSTSSFLRYKFIVSQGFFSKLKLSGSLEDEESRFQKNNSSLLLNNSFHFREYQTFINNVDTSKISTLLKYINRRDWGPSNESMKASTQANAFNLEFASNASPNNRIKTVFSYRTLSIIDSNLTRQKLADNTLLIRIEYSLRLFKGFITSNQFFETGSGLEVKKEFSYLEVTPGTGVYSWIDYNSNGIKELNEFEVAVFKDQAKFIRVFTPTNDFVRTYNNQYNQVLTINPSSIISGSSKGLKKFVSRFYDQIAFRTDRKITNNPQIEKVLWPFSNLSNDTSLATLVNSLRNTFSFNRLDPIYGLDFFTQQNKNKTLLVNGYEERANNFNGLRLRINALKIITVTTEYQEGIKYLTSDFFASRNYNLKYNEIKPELAYQPSVVWRISLIYSAKQKKNTLKESLGEQTNNQSLATELKFNSPSKGTFLAKFQVLDLKFKGDANSPVGFEMLEGLQPGINYTWNVNWQRSINSNLQLNVNYDGRKSPTTKTIHTGGVQLRAYF